MSYRSADAGCLLELERERERQALRLRDEAEADRAMVAAMKNPLIAVRSVVPRGTARTVAISALAAVVLPTFGAVCIPTALSGDARGVLAGIVLVSGLSPALLSVVLGVKVLLDSSSNGRMTSVAAVLTGLLALPLTLVCAIIVAIA